MESQKNLTVPAAIIIAGAIVGIAILFTQFQMPVNRGGTNEAKTDPLPPVTNQDRILGNPDAPIMVIEYSDPSCPFCKVFHNSMTGVMDSYIKSGKVAWVYRHFPLDKPTPQGTILHPKAGKEAQAFECAGDLGGNNKFFEYSKIFYERTPSVTNNTPDGMPSENIPKIAKEIGLNETDFIACLDSGKFSEKVENEFQTGARAGVTGTPYTFVITKSGKNVPIEGNRVNNVKMAIDSLLVTDGGADK